MSIGPNHRDTYGHAPCIPPHILGRLLDKLRPLKARIKTERNTIAWAAIDRLAEAVEASK